MPKVLFEGYRLSKDGGELWTGVVSRRSEPARSPSGGRKTPPAPPKNAVSAVALPPHKSK